MLPSGVDVDAPHIGRRFRDGPLEARKGVFISMFSLSKIIWGIIQPSTFIAILLFAGVVLSIRGKRAGVALSSLAAALYILAGFLPLADFMLATLEYRSKPGSGEDIAGAAGIIVLGGAVSGESRFGDRRVLLNDAADRMVAAVQLARQYPALPVILSGGSGALFALRRHKSEAELARGFFEGFGIAPPRLKLEDRSRNTLENAIYTAELVRPTPVQRWVLVTSAFHMPRAKALFEAQGFRIVPAPGDFRTAGPEDYWEFYAKPSDGLHRLDLAAKEWVGLVVSWLRGDLRWPKTEDWRPQATASAAG
jgi:uncharacterized SAM-binding protein YcdF (DUF218 family)